MKYPGANISLLLAAAFSACAFSSKQGDALLTHDRGFPLAVMNYLKFPDIPIDHAGSVRYSVLDLPDRIYPSGFTFEVPSDETAPERQDQPWRACKIHVLITSLAGKPLLEKTIDFSKDWNGNSRPGSDSKHRKIDLFIVQFDNRAHLPDIRSYRLLTRVLRPSSRMTDRVSIDAPAPIP
jgi:hypothetical protein